MFYRRKGTVHSNTPAPTTLKIFAASNPTPYDPPRSHRRETAVTNSCPGALPRTLMPLGANRPNPVRAGSARPGWPGPRGKACGGPSAPGWQCVRADVRGSAMAQKSQFKNETARSFFMLAVYPYLRAGAATGPPLEGGSGRLPALSHSRTAQRSRVEASPTRCASWKSSLKSGQLRQQMP